MGSYGYIIVRVTNKISARPYIAWVPDDETLIAEPMREWIIAGETMEILEYVPSTDVRRSHLIPQLNLWRDHLKEQDDG